MRPRLRTRFQATPELVFIYDIAEMLHCHPGDILERPLTELQGWGGRMELRARDTEDDEGDDGPSIDYDAVYAAKRRAREANDDDHNDNAGSDGDP